MGNPVPLFPGKRGWMPTRDELEQLEFFGQGRKKKSWLERLALYWDSFLTPDASPVASPRAAEPGPGTTTVVDAGSIFAITDGYITNSGGALDNASGFGQARQFSGIGDAIFVRALPNPTDSVSMEFGQTNLVGTRPTINCWAGGRTIRSSSQVIYLLGTFSAPTEPEWYGIIFMQNNVFHVRSGKLAYVKERDLTYGTKVAVGGWGGTGHKIYDLVECNLANYSSKYGEDFTEVTDTATSPESSDFDCETNCHIHYSYTVEDGTVVYVYGRYLNNQNFVGVQNLPARNTRILQNVGGSESTLATGPTLADATSYTIDIVINGTDFQWFIDGVKQGSTLTIDSSLTTANGHLVTTLATNDIVLTTHPYPKLGIATDRVVCPQVDDTADCESDFVMVVKNHYLGSSSILGTRLHFRIQDATNYMMLQTTTSGAVWIWKVVSGSASSLISGGAGSVSNGDDLVVTADGANIELFVNGTSVGSTSGGVFTSESGFKVATLEGGPATMDYVALFPRNPSLPADLK
jgi:hypothetical protein